MGWLNLLLLLWSLTATASNVGEQTDDAFYAVSTTISHESASDRYQVWSGSFSSGAGEQGFYQFLDSRAHEAAQQNPDFYFDTSAYDLTEVQREPQATKSFSLQKVLSRIAERHPPAQVHSVRNINGAFNQWLKVPENRMRLTFTLIAASIDGVTNTLILILMNDVSVHHGLAIGSVIAGLSGSWSMFTPQIAKFLNQKPSLVEEFFKAKNSLVFKVGKWIEGLLKWGLVEFAFVGAISGVSAQLGVLHFSSFGDWLMKTLGTTLLATAGQGLLDFTLSIEIDRSFAKAANALARRRVLFLSYVVGTAAASISALGSIGATMGFDYGNYMLYGLLAGGVVNLGRIEKKSIQSFLNQVARKCSLVFEAIGRQELPH